MPPQSITKQSTSAKAADSSREKLQEDIIQVDDKLYDAYNLAATHPGGELFVRMFSGTDATEAFLSYHRRKFPHDRVKQALKGQAKALKDGNADEDYLELCRLVENVLPRNKSFAPLSYYLKVIALLTASLSLEIYMHYTGTYVWYLTGLQGWFFALIGLNIQHDANHGAISKYSFVNRFLGLTQNWIGGSAIDWIHQHVVQHHIHPNNVDEDPDIVGNAILRLNPLKPLLEVHAFQFVYIFLLLALFGMSHIFFSLKNNLDAFHHIPFSKLVNNYHWFEEGTILFFAFRWIILPQIVTGLSLYTFLNILPMFIVGGYYLAAFFLISHNFEGVRLFDRNFNLNEDQSFLRKQVATASNVGGAWLCFLNGGLNYQIEHHLFPRIQHSHYPTIAPIVREYCEAKGVPYVHFPTVMDNFASCVKHLYQMGSRPLPSGYTAVQK